jgi:hypothetical protein
LYASTIATPVLRKEASIASTRIIAILESHGVRSIQKAFNQVPTSSLYVNNGSKHDLFGYIVFMHTFHLWGRKTDIVPVAIRPIRVK